MKGFADGDRWLQFSSCYFHDCVACVCTPLSPRTNQVSSKRPRVCVMLVFPSAVEPLASQSIQLQSYPPLSSQLHLSFARAQLNARTRVRVKGTFNLCTGAQAGRRGEHRGQGRRRELPFESENLSAAASLCRQWIAYSISIKLA